MKLELITIPFIALCLSTFATVIFIVYISRQKPLNQLQKAVFSVFVCLLIMSAGVLLQNICYSLFNINPIYFENIIYVGTCFLPVTVFFTALIFKNSKIKLKKRYFLVCIIPIISILMVWTNNIHHLFYEEYSLTLNKMIFGSYFYVYSAYTYGLLFVSIIILIRSAIRTSGFFSKQTILIIVGTAIPVIINLLGYLNIINITVYATPISFSIGILFYSFAILKFRFLSITPIALEKIVDRMSDSYLVINENNIITDFNRTFLRTFQFDANEIRNKDFTKLMQITESDSDPLALALNKARTSPETFTFERHFSKLNKYFNIEINNITNNGNFLGILILFKDITQHIEDMNTIKSNQDLLIEKERLASLGQMIGGIAHNLKTPIMSISGAAEGLKDLVKEYDSSIEDPDVTPKDHHDIANDMDKWIEKIKTHTSYMSDIITAVKGQAVTLSENESDSFTVDELIKRVNILMKHELKNALIDMNVIINVDGSISLNGNVNSLVQVINNLISNAIQSYNGKTNESIDLKVNKNDTSIAISVTDHGCGMSKEVKDKLFKEMITTKGKNGTGLGLFMSYSTIRGHFNGNMTFESEVDVGTTFNIVLPL